MTSSEGFQYHFSITSKVISCGSTWKRNVAFSLTYVSGILSFAVLKWDEYLLVQWSFEIPVQMLLEPEGNLLDQNGKELEFEHSKG